MMVNASPDVLVHQLVGAVFLPPLNLLLLAVLGLWLGRSAWPKLGRCLLVVSLTAIYLLATPACSLWLNGLLEREAPISAAALNGVDAIVVLGGGKRPAPEYGGDEPAADTLVRLRYAAHLARLSGKPVLVSGGAPNGGTPEGQVMAASLHADFGVTARWVEEGSDTTADNARLSTKLLRRDGVNRIALVSQGWHLARAVPAFAAQGMQVVPAPTGFVRYEITGARLWVPQGRAMQECYSALRELIGIGYYALRHH